MKIIIIMEYINKFNIPIQKDKIKLKSKKLINSMNIIKQNSKNIMNFNRNNKNNKSIIVS